MGIISRPMLDRQIGGNLWSETATLIRQTHGVNKYGEEETPTSTEVTIKCVSQPLSAKDPRFATLTDSGVRINDTREFFTLESINTKSRDKIRYKNELYTVHSTALYDTHSESIFIRDEVQ